MSVEKVIGESAISKQPKDNLRFKIGNNVIGANNIKEQAITPRKFSPEVELDWLNPILENKCKIMEKQMNELRQLVTSYSKNGLALSNYFGSNEDIGMSQKAITDTFRAVWDKLNEITGEPSDGIIVTITPDVFVSEGMGKVQVTVSSRGNVFEKVKIYVNDELVINEEYTYGFMKDIFLTETSMIKTVVQMMGVEYTNMKVVTKLFPFFIGSGELWRDAMTVDNAQTYKGHLNDSYDITVNNDGDKIFVIIPKRLAYQMIRVDMNGFEVPMITHEHDDLLIYESTNMYSAGRYNLDITCNCNCN